MNKCFKFLFYELFFFNWKKAIQTISIETKSVSLCHPGFPSFFFFKKENLISVTSVMYIATQQSVINSLDSFRAIQLDTFVYLFYCFFPLESIKARDFLKMTPIPACLLANLLTAVLVFEPCLTTSLLSSSPLEQPLIILSAYPLEQSAFDSHRIARGCFYPWWQKKQKSSSPYPGDTGFRLRWRRPVGQSALLLCVASRTKPPALLAPLLSHWVMCFRIPYLL